MLLVTVMNDNCPLSATCPARQPGGYLVSHVDTLSAAWIPCRPRGYFVTHVGTLSPTWVPCQPHGYWWHHKAQPPLARFPAVLRTDHWSAPFRFCPNPVRSNGSAEDAFTCNDDHDYHRQKGFFRKRPKSPQSTQFRCSAPAKSLAF